MAQRGPVVPLATSASSQQAGAMTHAHRDDQFIHLNLTRALQLHRRLASGIALGGLLLALVYTIARWPVYTAKSQIYVQPVQSKVMAQSSDQYVSINAAAYDAYIQQQVQSASSPAVLTSALKKLGPGAWQRKNESEQIAADRLGHAVDAARIGTGYEAAITARADDPLLAAKIANAVAESIAEKASGEGNAGDAQRIAVLRDERDRIQNELKADYAEQDDLNKQLGMAAVGTAPPDLIDDQIAKTRDELIKAQTDHDQAEARFSAMKAGEGASSAAMNAEADELIAADPGLSSMKTSLNQRRAVLITQMANLTPQNPGYKLAADELAKINTSLDAMMKDLRSEAAVRIQQKLRTDLERTAHVEEQLNGQLRELARTAAGATPKLQRVNDLATNIVRLRNRYSAVDEQLHNLMLEDSAPGAVHISVAAVPPLHPSLGKILKGALPLALGGLILGLLAAIIANKLDPLVYIAADIEEMVGFAPMAVLPDFDDVSERVAGEHLLRLAASIEHAGRQTNLRTFIFTGTSHYTGVTTVSNRVKDILSSMGNPAALLDATGDSDHEDRQAEDSTALLRQVNARTELDEESLVLVDTAPITLSAETEYLARSVGGAIVVVQSGVTTRAQLLTALNTLQRLGTGAVGFVLNRVCLAKADPAFRHSLQDMEKHLRNQGASNSIWPVRWRGIIEDPARIPDRPSGESALPAHSKPATECADQQAPFGADARPKLAATPESHSEPTHSSPAETPWWLLPPSPQPPPPPPITACAAGPVQAEYPAQGPPLVHPPKLPDWLWEQGSKSFSHLHSVEAQGHVQEQAQPEVESRMDRLRSLFSNVGLADLNRNYAPLPEEREPTRQVVADISQVPSRGFDADVALPPTHAVAEKTSATVPEAKVIAKPEILSPREFVPVKSGRRNRDAEPEVDNDIVILPAKRGQYTSR